MIDGANISQIIFALSEALDLVGVDDLNHGKRVAHIALEISKIINSRTINNKKLFHASLLHDCGVSSSRIHNKLAFEFDWNEAKDHCLTGYKLLNQVEIFKDISPLILLHHTHWENLKNFDYSKSIIDMSNLIFLADRIDITILNYCAKNEQKSKILSKPYLQKKMSEFKNDFFKPEFVDAFMEVSEKEAFWFNLEEESLKSNLTAFMKKNNKRKEIKIEIDLFKEISKLFAYFVDAKSEFTADHSIGVASLAKFISNKIGLEKELVSKVEIAALLHDLGKLKIPDELLEKKGSLTEEEFNVIKYHSFETNKILSKINGIQDIALWASQHHEKLNGKGYPYHFSAEEIPLPSRIIAVSDIFQALAQKRPYREALKSQKILSILKEKVVLNEIDKDIVNLVEDNLEECWKASLITRLC